MVVGVVILNFKVKDETLKCIRSVLNSDYKNIEIVIVDNNSDDGLEGDVKKFPEVRFFQSGSNVGYSGGNNLGIKKVLDDGADFVFVLNPDTEIDKFCISRLVNTMENRDIGVIGPKVLFSDRKTIWYAGGIFDRENVLGNHRGVDEKDQGQYDKMIETDYASGGAMFIRSEVFHKIGFFDEKYFLYYEDSDFCFRVKDAGFKIIYLPSAIVYHGNAVSTGLGSPLQDYFITRNRFLFASKFLSFKTQFALVREGIKNFTKPVRRAAMFDYFVGNFGKGSYQI